MTAATRLRARADAYSSDAARLRALGNVDAAVLFEAVRDELRRCADDLAAADDDLRSRIESLCSESERRSANNMFGPVDWVTVPALRAALDGAEEGCCTSCGHLASIHTPACEVGPCDCPHVFPLEGGTDA